MISHMTTVTNRFRFERVFLLNTRWFKLVERDRDLGYNAKMKGKDKTIRQEALADGLRVSDTLEKIREMLIAGYRRLSPQQKLKQVDELTKAVQQCTGPSCCPQSCPGNRKHQAGAGLFARPEERMAG